MPQDRFKDTLPLKDAMRLSGPVSFNIMLKPAGSLCNLDCEYCYYLGKESLYGGREPRMTEGMLETAVREYIQANDVPEVTFNWHGGEPLVLGLDFYRKALLFERKYGEGRKIFNTIQTNGTLIDAEWARFFARNDFLVGLSLDGPADVHDRFRRDKGGRPTFDRVMRGVGLLRDHGVSFNTMSAVNKASEGRGVEIYEFLRAAGSRYMQFMPVLEHVKGSAAGRPHIVPPDEEGAETAPWSVDGMAFGRLMNDIFDVWVKRDVGETFVVEFDSVLANYCGIQPGMCIFDRTCGGCSVIEHNGDLYPCDHFVYPEYLVGNIGNDDLRAMMASEKQVRFGIDKHSSLPRKCRRCRWLSICNGECPKHRFDFTDDGEAGLNALCDGYRLFFGHTAPYMEYMRDLLAKGLPPSLVMSWNSV